MILYISNLIILPHWLYFVVYSLRNNTHIHWLGAPPVLIESCCFLPPPKIIFSFLLIAIMCQLYYFCLFCLNKKYGKSLFVLKIKDFEVFKKGKSFGNASKACRQQDTYSKNRNKRVIRRTHAH